MRTSRTHARTLVLGLLTAALLGTQAGSIAAADPVTTTLVPIGSDYQADTLELFAGEAADRDADGEVHILVIPITYSLDAFTTTKSERKKNLSFADNRRGQVEAACDAVRDPVSQTCLVELVPALVRSDAYEPAVLDYFEADIDGMYVLGGDQTVAMNLVAETPLEDAMTDAFLAGAVFGGNSAGAAVQSIDMINGYTPGNGPETSLRQGAVELCTPDTSPPCVRGLEFGFPNVITDQHVFEYGRMGRSLNVAVGAAKPVLGVDAATGAVVTDYALLRDVTGDTAAYVIDPATFGAGASWGGPNDTLSTRAVAVHVLAAGTDPGVNVFDLSTMVPLDGGTPVLAPDITGRGYPAFATGDTAGALILAGGIVDDPAGAVGETFVTEAGGPGAHIVVLATGYPKDADARADAKAIAAALEPSVASAKWFNLGGNTRAADVLAALDGATGVVITASDRSLVGSALAAWAPVIDAIEDAWRAGELTVLADDAAAAAMGTTYVAEGISADVEASAMEDMLAVTTAAGLGWVTNLDVEPRLLPDQHWPQLLQLSRITPSAPAAGIDVGTAVLVQGGSAAVVGESAVVVLDASHGSFGAGDAIAATWLLLDSYVGGEAVTP
jgi:cyanophycinase-like exopeptidase